MQANEQEPKKKKKTRLSEKMGLDQGSETYAPPMTQPGIFPGSVEGELNARAEQNTLGTKIKEKLNRRRSDARKETIAR